MRARRSGSARRPRRRWPAASPGWSASGTTASPSSARCAVGSPSVTTSTTGSASGCRRRCRPASDQRVLQVGALHPLRLDLGQLHRGQPPGGPVEADDLQRVLPEPGRDQVRQRQRGLLHRAPAALLHHRERQVDAERDRGRGPALGLDHLEVLDRRAGRHRLRRSAARRSTALETVRTASSGSSSPNSHGRVSAGELVGRPGAVVVVVAARRRPRAAAKTRLQRGLAEPAQRLRGQRQPVVAAGHAALPLELALQLAQRLAGRPRRRGRAAARAARRRRRRGSRRGGPGRAAARAPRGRRARRPPRRRRRSRAARRPAACSTGGPGPARAAARAGCRDSCAICAARSASASACSSAGRAPRAARGLTASASAARRPPAGGPARRSARRRSPGSPGRTRRACP